MSPEELAHWRLGNPCPYCDDSGYIETVHGGFWAGHGMSFTHTICDCPCGDDVRRELMKEDEQT